MKYFLCLTIFITLLTVIPAVADFAFVANVDGNWDLFVVDHKGNNLNRLTQTPYDEKDPSWSVDRKSIVFLTSDGQLNLIDVATKATRSILAGDKNLRKYSPSFSIESKKIVYAQARSGANDDSDLRLFDLESETDGILIDQHSIQMWPAYSPDNKSLVYANLHCNEACGRFIQELWLTSPTGKSAKQLIMTNSFCKQPVYSPDGNQIAFASDKAGNFDIWTLALDTMQLEQITQNANTDESPAWSPDGKKIAFISNRSGRPEIWVKDLLTDDFLMLKPFGDKEVACRDVAW